MLKPTIRLYRNAFSGLSRPMWWLALVMFINRCGTMVVPFLTVYLTHKGYSITQAGMAMGAFGLGSILGGFVGGKLTDRFGHFPIQVGSLAMNGVLFIVLGMTQNLTQFMICVFLVSTFGDAFRPANAAAVAAFSDDANRTRCYALNRLAVNLGWAVGPAVGGILASYDYTYLFWADGLTCIAASFLLYHLFRKHHQDAKSKDAPIIEKGLSAYRDKPFLLGMALIFLVGLCFFQMFSIVPVYYKEQLQLNEATIGWLLALNGLIIGLLEMVLVYKLENRYSVFIYLVSGSFLIGAAFMLLNIAPLLTIALLSILVITFGEMLLFPFMNNFWVNRSTTSNRGEYAAVYTMSFSAAIVLAPTMASQIASRAGFSTLWWIDGILCTFAAAGYYLLKKSLQEHERI